MTPSVKVLHQQTVHQSAPPRCRWAVCMCCVRMSAAHAQVCVCVCELACWISFSGPGGGQEKEPFSFTAQLGVADRQDVSHSFSWLELPGERSLIVDTEKEHCVISPLWPMTCLETSRESSYFIGGNDPETTWLDFWRNPWLLCLFLCLFEPDPTVFLTDNCKHVIVLTQIRSWNNTRQTLGKRPGCRWTRIGSSHFSSICWHHGGKDLSVTALQKLIWSPLLVTPRSCACSSSLWCTVCGMSTQTHATLT